MVKLHGFGCRLDIHTENGEGVPLMIRQCYRKPGTTCALTGFYLHTGCSNSRVVLFCVRRHLSSLSVAPRLIARESRRRCVITRGVAAGRQRLVR